MKLMFASDIHGSALWCRRLLDAFEKEQAEKLFLLGDLLYHGPRNPLPEDYDPQATAELLNTYRERLLCVRGNCDADVDQLVLSFPITAESLLVYAGGRQLFLTHGHVYSPERPPLLQKGDVLINGHFHTAAVEEKDEYLYLNPGSVSLPKDNFRGYLLFDGSCFTLKALSGEILQKQTL